MDEFGQYSNAKLKAYIGFFGGRIPHYRDDCINFIKMNLKCCPTDLDDFFGLDIFIDVVSSILIVTIGSHWCIKIQNWGGCRYKCLYSEYDRLGYH